MQISLKIQIFYFFDAYCVKLLNDVFTFGITYYGLFLVLNDNLVVQISERCETVCFLSKF